MSVSPETDPDGVVGRDDETTEVHENVREGTEGVETPGDGGTDVTGGGDAATGLIGNGHMTDPRYLAQR
ncbi:MAG TPA: hypothetical protein VGX28_13025 [Frankiaceae bacterium]|jgi:isopentenyl phosphate kinase|nr:hypothetical protein [Frankiaceae bacterium]